MTEDGPKQEIEHATAVAIDGAGLLLRGPAGAGKSDLAIRLIDGGGALIADDYVLIKAGDDRLTLHTPPAIDGMIEVRGYGIVTLAAASDVPLTLVVNLVDAHHIERMPDLRPCRILGVTVPQIDLAPFEASATAKLRLILHGGGPLL